MKLGQQVNWAGSLRRHVHGKSASSSRRRCSCSLRLARFGRAEGTLDQRVDQLDGGGRESGVLVVQPLVLVVPLVSSPRNVRARRDRVLSSGRLDSAPPCGCPMPRRCRLGARRHADAGQRWQGPLSSGAANTVQAVALSCALPCGRPVHELRPRCRGVGVR
ncbi:hypothetical protein T492DRAFT_926314 [Pavlovales sp. CCMP2436]|nr:hypothetical protein T492DRAFT_926314 [Pavlovales sp. CCMP2436]